jgi:1-acyl-sn-glycerol-3-phosphate acyltransferase
VARVLLACVLIGVETVVLGVASLVFGLVDRSGRLLHGIVRLWGRLVLHALGVRVDVEAAGTPPAPAVYAANHGSAIDIPILFAHLPVEFRIIHKRSLYLVPVVGWHLLLGGHIAVDGGKAFRARRSLAAAARRIAAGTSVMVFPEGTRAPDERIRLFKRGSFLLAIHAGVPVVPVSLVGVKDVVPAGILTLRPGRVTMRLHPAVPTSGRAAEDAEALAEEVRRTVARGCGQELPA